MVQEVTMKYQDIYVVDDLEEAEQFLYKHNNQTVEVGTAVGYDVTEGDDVILTCFEGIYYDPDATA